MIVAPAVPLVTTRRIVVVASGALALVPFAVLPLTGGDGALPLLARHEVVHAPSATTLAAMRGLTTRRPPASKGAVVFADPIFATDDPRASLAATTAPLTPADSAGTRALAVLGRSLPRLAFSRTEARAIEALRPRDVMTFLDGRATRDRVLAGVADYRFVHFATHAIVHADVPALSSIALSFVDDRGRMPDPLLTVADVYEMTLRAEVVVLSACSTASGKGVPGEGVIGLARAFMYAGAPRVVASLWQVNDLATAELMKRFYRGMLIEGRTPAAALHAAQQQLAAIPLWSSPYYWAPFVLQGDWR